MNIGDIRRRLAAYEPTILPPAAFEASVVGSGGGEGLWRDTARTALSVAVVAPI